MYPPVQAVPLLLPPPFLFTLSKTDEPAKAGPGARDRRALQQLALNVLSASMIKTSRYRVPDVEVVNGTRHVSTCVPVEAAFFILLLLLLLL